MMAAIVAPFGSCSILSTVDCLDDDGVGLEEIAFEATALASTDGLRAETLRLTGVAGLRDDLRADVAGFDFGLLVAIWLSFGINDSIMCCH